MLLALKTKCFYIHTDGGNACGFIRLLGGRVLVLRVLLWLVLSTACGDDDDYINEAEDTYIYTQGNAESRGPLSLSASTYLPHATTTVYTESFYAEVTASDRLQIIFLIDDTTEMAESRQKLSTTLAAMLKHVINSNWSIAVTTLHAASSPQVTITKYQDSFDYEKKFAQAVTDLKQAPGAARQPAQDSVRAFVIVTDKDLTAATRHNVDKMLAEGGNNRVYALLNTAGGSSAFIDWRDAQGQKIVNRYAAMTMADYALPLQEMSHDLASVLRSNFFLRGYRSLEGRHVVFSGDYLDAKVVWNPSRSGQTGHLSSNSLVRGDNQAARTVFINSKLPAGMCIDVKYSIER